jgi:flagellar protein FliT
MGSIVIEIYEALAAASSRMLAAARAQDWDGLLAAESDCARLVERARAQPEPATLGSEERQRKRDIIRRMLAEDAEIRSRLQPWMAQLDQLLHTADRRRRVERSYGE